MGLQSLSADQLDSQLSSKMVDTYDLFKRLSSGAKFNQNKYKDDFEKFKVMPNTG